MTELYSITPSIPDYYRTLKEDQEEAKEKHLRLKKEVQEAEDKAFMSKTIHESTGQRVEDERGDDFSISASNDS